MARLFEGKRTFLHPVLRPLETLTYKLIGVNEQTEQRWTQYTAALLAFSIFSFLFVYLIQRLQGLATVEPATLRRSPGAARSGIQYRCQFRHKHELASLLR